MLADVGLSCRSSDKARAVNTAVSLVCRAAFVLISVLVLTMVSCASPSTPVIALETPAAGRYEYSRLCMGVKATITLYASSEDQARAAASLAFARLAELDALMSDYRIDGPVAAINRSAGGPPTLVAAELGAITRQALAISERTGGAFDITSGPAVSLWRKSRATLELPSPQAVSLARGLIGWRRVNVVTAASGSPDSETSASIGLIAPGVTIDFGAIGKGYAAQEALKLLRLQGCPRAYVALGGDIAVGESPPGAAGWKIDVSSGSGSLPVGTLVVSNACISTSGGSEQYVEIGGRQISHIIDPRTGEGLPPGGSVTLVASDGAEADALATAACVLLNSSSDCEVLTSILPADAAAIYVSGAGELIFSVRLVGKTARRDLRWVPRTISGDCR